MDLSYHHSETLKELLQKIDFLKAAILLTPISPKDELKIRFDSLTKKIHYSLMLSGISVNRRKIAKLIAKPTIAKAHTFETDVLSYKKPLVFIQQKWLVNKNPVTIKTVQNLASLVGSRLKTSEKDLKVFLNYIQAAPVHGVIQAGLCQLFITKKDFFTKANARIARLLALLFLYKSFYDIRGFLSLEEQLYANLQEYKYNLDASSPKGNVTKWLEYFAGQFVLHLVTLEKTIQTPAVTIKPVSNLWKLNDRQKEILELMDEPNASITNKKVQKLFKISQITASRDLAKLANLNIIFPHGKGRSVFYTRV